MKVHFVFTLSLFFMSCEEDIRISDLESGIVHGNVRDKTTNQSIPNATVYLKGFEIGTIITPGSSFTVATTISDSNGSFSFDFNYDENYGYYCSAVADQYFNYQEEFIIDNDVFGNAENVLIELYPIAYLSIHCINELPYDTTDQLTLSLLLGGEYPQLNGTDIDTVLCCFAVLGNAENHITWYVDKNNISTFKSADIYCSSFDTTYFEINY